MKQILNMLAWCIVASVSVTGCDGKMPNSVDNPHGKMPTSVRARSRAIPPPYSYKRYNVPDAGIASMVATPDGMVWYAARASNTIGVLASHPGIARSLRPPTENSGPDSIAIDKAGHVWFTEARGRYPLHGDQIGTVKPGNHIVETTVPTTITPARAGGAAHFTGLAVSADGSLWFLSPTENGIWRYKDGQFRFIRLPRETQASSIAADNAGSVFIYGYRPQVIGIINEDASKIREVTFPGTLGLQGKIAYAGGNIWFTTTQEIVRMKNGKIRRSYQFPDAQSFAIDINEKAVWFTGGAPDLPLGLNQLDPGTGRISSIALPEDFTAERTMCNDGQDGLWIAGVKHFGSAAAQQQLMHVIPQHNAPSQRHWKKAPRGR